MLSAHDCAGRAPCHPHRPRQIEQAQHHPGHHPDHGQLAAPAGKMLARGKAQPCRMIQIGVRRHTIARRHLGRGPGPGQAGQIESQPAGQQFEPVIIVLWPVRDRKNPCSISSLLQKIKHRLRLGRTPLRKLDIKSGGFGGRNCHQFNRAMASKKMASQRTYGIFRFMTSSPGHYNQNGTTSGQHSYHLMYAPCLTNPLPFLSGERWSSPLHYACRFDTMDPPRIFSVGQGLALARGQYGHGADRLGRAQR